jgi:hypothetical protein
VAGGWMYGIHSTWFGLTKREFAAVHCWGFSGDIYPNPIDNLKEYSPISLAEKHPNLEVTTCLHFVTTNIKFAYIES